MRNIAMSSSYGQAFYTSLGVNKPRYTRESNTNNNSSFFNLSQKYIAGLSGINQVLKHLVEIRTMDYKYVFKNSLTLIIRKDKYWKLDVEKYDIHCISDSLDDILHEFSENIDVAWKMYVECDESELTQDAIDLRNVLKRDITKHDSNIK